MEIKSEMKMKVVADDKNKMTVFQATNKEKPKPEDVEALNKLFEESPYVWQQVGNLAARVKDSIIGMQCGQSHIVMEATKRKVAEMRDQLGWKDSSRLEKIIIEQVCMNWLRLNHLELVHEQKTRESHTLPVGQHWDKLLTQAQKRYLRACESLAKVRKLLAEAELREQQARNKRSKSAAVANQLLKDLTTT
jgi:hypothetical protein